MWASQRFDFEQTAARITKNTAMSDAEIRRKAPSVFAEEPWQKMSGSYLFVPTIDVINAMRENGFMVVRAMQSKSRIEGKADFTKHMVVFRNASANGPAQVGDCVPEIVLVNSHDGTSSYQLHAGMFRLACLNGLIVADTTLGQIKCRHSKKAAHDIIDGTNTLIREVPVLADKIDHLRSITISRNDEMALAEAALMLRYDTAKGDHAPIEPVQLLNARRQADRAPTLWNAFNRIEENMIKGGLSGRTSTDKPTTTRKVQSVAETVRLEKSLWHLADYFAQNIRG